MRPEFMVHDADLRAGECNTAASAEKAPLRAWQSFASLHNALDGAALETRGKGLFLQVKPDYGLLVACNGMAQVVFVSSTQNRRGPHSEL